jgi:beta-lactamase class C
MTSLTPGFSTKGTVEKWPFLLISSSFLDCVSSFTSSKLRYSSSKFLELKQKSLIFRQSPKRRTVPVEFSLTTGWVRSLGPILFYIKLGVIAILIVAALDSNAVPTLQNTYDRKIIKEFGNYVELTYKKWRLPGLVLGVVKNNKLIYARSFGYKELGSREKINDHTIFRVASLSKGITSTFVGKLVEGGVINWSDQVIDYIPELSLKDARAGEALTITNLLSHTTGLPTRIHSKLLENGTSHDDIIAKLADVELDCPVGECYRYQNSVFSLAGKIVEQVTNSSFEKELKRWLTRPLRMNDTTTTQKAFDRNRNKAKPHIREKGKFVVSYDDLESSYYEVAPAGGINSSLHDMIRWLRAQMGGFSTIVSKELLIKLHSPVIDTPSEKLKNPVSWRDARIRDAKYALGWRVYNYQNHKMIFHSGMLNGYTSSIAFMPKNNIGIVVLSNSATAVPNLLMAKFFDLYLELPEIDYSSIEYKKMMEVERNALPVN